MGSGTSHRTKDGAGTHVRALTRLVVAVVVLAVGLVLAPGMAAAAPSDRQISDAETAREAAAERVGTITAELAQAEAELAAAQQASQLALQDYEETLAAYEEARLAADAAAVQVQRATAELGEGRQDVIAFARSSYMRGTTSPGTAALLSADGPAQLVERAALLEAVSAHRVDVVEQLTVLQEKATAAEDGAQQAVEQVQVLQAAATETLAAAQEQEVAARSQAEALTEQRAAVEAELVAAQETVYGLEAAREAAAARQAAQQPPAAGPGSGGGSPTAPTPPTPPATTPDPVTPPAGPPSSSAADTAIAAAMSQRGLPYSWGGGGPRGPSYGIPPDTGIYGFDCSGLTEYAYAQAGIAIGGTSRTQYARFSHATVARSDLRAGDLVFWGSGSSYMSIYHVALYLGNGQIVHAPESGDVVRTATMRFGSDYYGAVRPSA